MTDQNKRKALILLGLVMISTMIIAASLSQLDLKPGMPPPKFENNQVVIPTVEKVPSETISINKLIIGFLILISAGAILYGIYIFIKGAKWKDLTDYLKPMFVISLVIISILYFILFLPKSVKPDILELPGPTAETPITAPLGSVPQGLIWLVGLGLLITSILIGTWIFVSASKKTTPIDQIRIDAENARQELRTGLGLKDVILRCYRQMSLALENQQGIERKDYMTTREFEKLSESLGVPTVPIHQLTQLFEAVRYGNWQPNTVDEDQAINCLEAIELYCRQTRGDFNK
jgi:hypothetical protein